MLLLSLHHLWLQLSPALLCTLTTGLMQWELELTAQYSRILTSLKTRATRLLNKLFLCEEFIKILTSKISNGLSIACHFLYSSPFK